jgi:predicted lactoylglutathione lyase
LIIVLKALEAGAKRYKEPDDQGWMYGWGFQDLDGVLWEIIYMDERQLSPR